MGDNGSLIRNRKYAAQIREFSGMKFGTIIPTDVDGLIEYHNKAFVIIETKHKEAELPRGQKVALEVLCDTIEKDRRAILIVASHESNGDIDVATTDVIEYRFRGHWHTKYNPQTTRQLVERFINWVDGNAREK